jgi:hypothetical protein
MENNVIPELQLLLDEVEKKYGRPIATSKDFNTLSVVLDYECHEVLSSSTLKRLWGYVSLRTTPRKATLDILSKYVGYKDFSDFRTTLLGKLDETSGYLETSYLSADEIPDGGILRIGWEPNRLLRLRKTGTQQFDVIESHHSKLQEGDRFETSCFFKGLPLILPGILRNGKSLPSFIAGKEKGLNLLQVEP